MSGLGPITNARSDPTPRMMDERKDVHGRYMPPATDSDSDDEDDGDEDDGDDDERIYCPVEGCEDGSFSSFDDHMEFHASQGGDDRARPRPPSTKEVSLPKTAVASQQPTRTGGPLQLLRRGPWLVHGRESVPVQSPAPGRLGVAELGRYAFEQQMPMKLIKYIRDNGQVVGKGVVPVLAQLLEQNKQTEYAYLCHPAVEHVSKLRREGGFCGYRNIQMLCSYIIATKSAGHDRMLGELPCIFLIQKWIHWAWDKGINANGLHHTGGLLNTRKYIGTPEAETVLSWLEVPHQSVVIKSCDEFPVPEERLFQVVEWYFQSGATAGSMRSGKARGTLLPPIYLQHRGHSMTIVGFEKRRCGRQNLLVFDPATRDPPSVAQYIGQAFSTLVGDFLLSPYRRGASYLKIQRQYEMVILLSGDGPESDSGAKAASGSLDEGHRGD